MVVNGCTIWLQTRSPSLLLRLATPRRKLQLHAACYPYRRKSGAMERQRAEPPERLDMVRGPVTLVAFEAVSRVKLRILYHQRVAGNLKPSRLWGGRQRLIWSMSGAVNDASCRSCRRE